MAYYGNDRVAPKGLLEKCHEGPEALKAWCKSKSDSLLIVALKAIHLHHAKVRVVIQDELKERRKRRMFQILVIAVPVAVLTLVVGLLCVVR
jgi:succinate dehydrogenase hydrophobic anchor subunit